LGIFAERLKEALKIRDIKQSKLADLTKIQKSAITQYLQGKYVAKQDKLYEIAKALDVSESWLMGRSDDMTRIPDYLRKSNDEDFDIFKYDNIIPVVPVKIPVIGTVPCGTPQEAIENAEEYTFQFPEDFKVNFDFALKCIGDSMINAGINENDFVFIKKQDFVDNGEIAIILIEGDVTLKRFYYDNEEKKITLLPENPKHIPKSYEGNKLEEIKIIGKAVAVLNWLNVKKI